MQQLLVDLAAEDRRIEPVETQIRPGGQVHEGLNQAFLIALRIPEHVLMAAIDQ